MKKFALFIVTLLLSVCLGCLFAACDKEEQTYTVSVYDNYRGGGVSEYTLKEGESFSQPEAPVYDGYMVEYWSYDADGAQRVTFPVSVTQDLSIYAQWAPSVTYTVSFSGNGGQGTLPDLIQVSAGGSVELPSAEGLSRDFYLFAGWQLQDGTVYEAGQSFTPSSDTTFTAYWRAAVAIAFEADGGEGELPAAETVFAGTQYTLPAADLTKSGYAFDGWLAGGAHYAVGDTIDVGTAQTLTLTAAWNGEYTLSFTGAETQQKQIGFVTGGQIELPGTTETREDYEFAGWQSQDGTVYAAGETYIGGYADETLEAVWTHLASVVTYIDWDGTVLEEQEVTVGAAAPAPDTFVTELYEFVGWYTAEGSEADLSSITENVTVYAEYSVEFSPASYFTYTTQQGRRTLTGAGAAYSADMPVEVVFPASIGGMPVLGIANFADFRNSPFWQDTSLEKIYIPSNWTRIGDRAFYNADVREIVFAEESSLTVIGASAFRDNQIGELAIPASVTSIGETAFYGNESLTKVTFSEPDSGITLGNGLFQNCSKLVEVELPSTLTAIPSSMFYYCVSLPSIAIPASVTSIGRAAFDACEKLRTVDIPQDSRLTTLGETVFAFDDLLESIYLPAGVTEIPYSTFQRCDSLKEVTLAGAITTIGENAFRDCVSLKRLNSDTDGEFNLPASVTSIGDRAFARCALMQTISFGENSALETVGMYAFAGNYEDVFEMQTAEMSLTAVHFPASVASIGTFVFYQSDSVASVTVEEGNAHYTADGQGLYETATRKLIGYALASSVTEYTIQADTEQIDDRCFWGVKYLVSVTLPSALTVVPFGCFAYAESLESVDIPEENVLERIEEGGFTMIPTLSEFAFEKMIHLTDIGVEVFDCAAFTAISLPDSLVTIGAQAFYSNAELVSVSFSDSSRLESIGSGAFIGDITLNEDKTGVIGSKLASFCVPASVTSIGSSAFAYTTGLTSFTFAPGSQLTSIASSMFDSSALPSIELPASVKTVGSYAFARAGLKSFTASLDTIERYAFYDAEELESVTLSGSVAELGIWTFGECKSLTSVTLPETLKSIGNYAFGNCTALQVIEFPASLISVGMASFLNTDLKTVTVRNTEAVVSIDPTTFVKRANNDEQRTPLAIEAIYVPAELVSAYQANTNWSIFRSAIRAIEAE